MSLIMHWFGVMRNVYTMAKEEVPLFSSEELAAVDSLITGYQPVSNLSQAVIEFLHSVYIGFHL